MKSNAFSKHDNRHTIENYGVYLGSGLGKKALSDPTRDQHRSDCKNFMDGRTEQNNFPTSSYVSGYKLITHEDRTSRRCISADGAHTKSQSQRDLAKCHSASAKETLRRFPHKYLLPKDLEGVRPSVSSTWWFNQERLLEERREGSPGQAQREKPKQIITIFRY